MVLIRLGEFLQSFRGLIHHAAELLMGLCSNPKSIEAHQDMLTRYSEKFHLTHLKPK
jgi:hypothetical protein